MALVRNAWSDLFVLGMAQCSASMNLSNILSTIVSHLQTTVQQEKLTAQRVRQVTTTICKVQEYVKAMGRLDIDEKEFALLKIIALFSTGTYKKIFLPPFDKNGKFILTEKLVGSSKNLKRFHQCSTADPDDGTIHNRLLKCEK